MSLDDSFQGQQHQSEFAPNQFPGYLLPDGSWRYGANAKTLADAAWGRGRRHANLKEDRNACGGNANGNDIAQQDVERVERASA